MLIMLLVLAVGFLSFWIGYSVGVSDTEDAWADELARADDSTARAHGIKR